MARPITLRYKDIAYLIFFLIHIPIIFIVDIGPLYPAAIKPGFISDLQVWYYKTYSDRFFSNSYPKWFDMYRIMELVYHVPVSVWAVGALIRDDPSVPIQLLVFAVQTALTTATCIAEYLSWGELNLEQKIALGQLYVPYCALAIFMGVDMYARLRVGLGISNRNGLKQKKKQ